MKITCKGFYNELLKDPIAALHKYVIMISGGDGDGESGVRTFEFSDKNQSVQDLTAGTNGMGKGCHRIGLSNKNRTEERPQIRENYFNAHYVSMWTDKLPSLLRERKKCSYYIPTRSSFNKNQNPDIMLTSQLSGCTFGIGKPQAAKQQQLVHIQPGNEGGLNKVNNRYHLKKAVRDLLGNHDIYSIFERENQSGDDRYGKSENRANVIGVRKNNEWKFYAQVLNRIKFNYFLLSVTEISELHVGATYSAEKMLLAS